MRIAFAGSSGTGKTTLTNAIAEAYGLPINPVGARSVAHAMGFETPYDVDKAGQREEFQRRLLLAKMNWEHANSAFVTDRTTFDNLAYTSLHDIKHVTEAMLSATEVAMKRYTHVFFCPISAVFNPARNKDKTYHVIYETLLKALMHRAVDRGVHLTYVYDTELDKRIARVQKALDGDRIMP
jgi:predicted ATPase